VNISFHNKVALVVGGTRGIGLKCAELLAENGAKVAVVGHNPANLDRAIAEIQKHGMARGYLLDVTNTPLIDGMVQSVIKEVGHIDILVCSTAVTLNRPTPASEIAESEWDRIILTNLKALFFVNNAVARLSMIPRQTGVIINISSQASLVTIPRNSPYAISKAGVNRLTRNEALEWAAYNIRVNAVAPTWVLTELVKPIFASNPQFEANELNQIPLRRFATVDDVANAVCFLASDAARMITGVILPVDGGRTL
jgi:NAD(P)-dependent dehydrogenase (short-subunit alcohol dehydrogenase family)